MSTYAPERSTDHVSRGQRKLISYLRKPRNLAFLASLLRQIQKIENAAFEIVDYVNIEAGFGIILDNLGSLVGRGRNGQTDDTFRRAIRAQIRANRSKGKPSDLRAVANLYAGTVDAFRVTDLPPGAVIVEATEGLAFVVQPLADLLEQARALGVRLHLVYNVADASEAWLWGWTGGTYADGATHGDGWTGDAASGGRDAHVIAGVA